MMLRARSVALFFLWFATVHAYFYVPNFMSTLPFQDGMAYVQSGQSIYMFGGENSTNGFINSFYRLNQTDSTFTWEALSQINPPNGTRYGQLMMSNSGNTLLLIGGASATTDGKQVPLQVYSHNFADHTWYASPGNTGNNSAGPLNRECFSATYDNDHTIYIFGGTLTGAGVFQDFYSYNTQTGAYTKLNDMGRGQYDHTASLLSNGKLVVVGGVISDASGNTKLAPMEQVAVYDPATNQWTMMDTTVEGGGAYPSTRAAHNAVVTADDKIILFGGNNGEWMRSRQYLNAIAILDTKTWTWSVPVVNGIPPSRRSYAVAGLLDGKHLTVGFGSALNTYYNDINVYSIEDGAWLQSFDATEDSGSSVSAGLIAGVTIAGVVLLAIILFLIWRFQSYIRWIVTRIHHDIWKPRTGEPIWAETTRIVCQVFLLFLFILFLVFVIRQAITSPNVTQRIEQAAAEVDVPDVRFCFDGFPSYPAGDVRSISVVCQTDTGYPCSSFVKPLDMSVFQPTFASNLGPVNCLLFRSDEAFKLTSTSGANNGSRLQFTLFADQSITYGRVHVSVYPKAMDPNVKVYNINDNIPVIMSDADVLNWQNGERNDIGSTNIFDIQPGTYSALSYTLVDHRYLQPVGWNYVGFAPITNSTPEVETNFREESPNPNYMTTHQDIGFLTIYPSDYATFIDREYKMYTLLNALGFVGGIFGILIAFQTWMFGYRPRSPWGVVHRWSVGEMKRSLLRGLQSNFKTSDANVIPLVHPVHNRFSVNNFGNLGYESDSQRVARVEERMQILELLFKAYYVDDEVFRSLDTATKNMPPASGQANNGPVFTANEKYDAHPIGRSNTGGFSHMFNRRQSSTSINSDSSAQQLNAPQPPHVQVHLRD